MLPDELDARLRIEAQRHGTTIADVVRDAVSAYFAAAPPRTLSFIGIGEGTEDLSEDVDRQVRDAIRARNGPQ